MAAKSKMQLLIELSSKLFNSQLMKLKKNFSKTTDVLRSKLGQLKADHMKAFTAMRDQFPMLGRGLELLTNKYVLMAGALFGIGLLMTKATGNAMAFNHEFLQIKQMNLDKTAGQMNVYKNQIRDAAFEVGTDLNDTTRAFYDLQSGTTLFGTQAVEVFKKVGNYSIATGADLNDSMTSTVKAMRAMGLGVKDIDGYLVSNAKTVQTGITTYAELAKVQTEFLGAAKGAQQGIDIANKVFAGFTSIAKNADVGANMTKTFFEGLTQNAEKIGKELKIDLFDNNNNLLGADVILKKIAEKFKTMNNREISNAITSIGGPEGLRGMLVKVQTGADDLLKTFSDFDASKFDLATALKNAKGDVTVLGNIVKHQWNIVLERLGEKILPVVATGLEWLMKLLKWVYNHGTLIATVITSIATAFGVLKLSLFATAGGFKTLGTAIKAVPIWGWIIAIISAIIPLIDKLVQKLGGWGEAWKMLGDLTTITIDNMKLDWNHLVEQIDLNIEGMKSSFKSLIQSIAQMFDNIGKAQGLFSAGLYSQAKDALLKPIKPEAQKETVAIAEKIRMSQLDYVYDKNVLLKKSLVIAKQMQANWNKPATEGDAATDPNKLLGNPELPSGNTNNDITKVTGAGSSIKNITINIDSLNKGGINTQNTILQKMNAQEIERWFNEAMMRVVRNVELSN